MTTPADIFGIFGRPLKKVVGAFVLPELTATGSGTVLLNSGIPGTVAIPAGASAVFLPLTEFPSGSGNYVIVGANLDGTPLPDTTDRPYTVECRYVDAATNMANYASISAAYLASTSAPVYARDIHPSLLGGMLRNGVWGPPIPAGGVDVAKWLNADVPTPVNPGVPQVDVWFVEGLPANPVENTEGSGDNLNIDIAEQSVAISGADVSEELSIT